MAIGQDDRCPCGSGRSTAQCHVHVVDEAPAPLRRRPTNTDGDPLLYTEDRYALDGDPEELIVRLRRLRGLLVEGEGPDGTRISFVRKGNRIYTSWDQTVVGHALVQRARLVLTTNSVRRADLLRKRVERVAGDLLGRRIRSHQDPTSAAAAEPAR